MSIYDITYCMTDCDQKDCVRNTKYSKPLERYVSMAMLDEDNPDKTHKDCKYKIQKPKGEE